MEELGQRYHTACTEGSDIHEHCPTLAKYAQECAHVTEAGVRSAVSSWALLYGLVASSQTEKRHIGIDLSYHANIGAVARLATQLGVTYTFLEGNDLAVPLEETDLFFIDTWHVYGHLRRELAKFAPLTRKYIIMHDTTVDAVRGESLRESYLHDIDAEVASSGYPREEIERGLWPAVTEFLEQHPEWKLLERFTNCNGLTVLQRVQAEK